MELHPDLSEVNTSWRDVLPIHPAAELFPPMTANELRELGADIKQNGLTSPIVLWSDGKSPAVLLDGRNRLDAIEMATGSPAMLGAIEMATGSPAMLGAPSIMAGKDFLACDRVITLDRSVDPYAFVISANFRRRHLNAEQKREVIAKLLKTQPEKSDRQIAEMLGVDHKTVASVRAEMEGRGEIPRAEARTDSKGRKQPTKRPRNHTRANLYRSMKLGADAVEKLKGTSLDNAREMDELVFLNRGAPKGGHTEIVKRFVADAAAGKEVSAIKYTKSGAAFRRDDIGADSSGKADRLRARVGALQAELRRREIKITGLESELADLKDDGRACEVVGGAVKKDEAWQIDGLVRAWKQASETARQKFMALFELQSAVARVTNEGLGNPDVLRRVEQ
jgi:hypothetical protein